MHGHSAELSLTLVQSQGWSQYQLMPQVIKAPKAQPNVSSTSQSWADNISLQATPTCPLYMYSRQQQAEPSSTETNPDIALYTGTSVPNKLQCGSCCDHLTTELRL